VGPDAFDFWLGDWDCVTEMGKARNQITREYNDAVILERFTILPPIDWSGMSVTTYDDQAGWRQSWVDQDGNHWAFVGQKVNGDPSFATVGPVDADQLFKRMVFSEIEEDRLHWRWEVSPDEVEWSVRMTVAYTRRD
jgi:hypothetical protein